jgi:methylated-DNA-[protein]-cysteine S-methyltransferase
MPSTEPHGYSAICHLSYATVGIRTNDTTITGIDFLPREHSELDPQDRLAEKTIAALAAYGEDPEYHFQLPIQLDGTDYQRKVWRALQTLASGETITYGSLAKRLHSGARAIGNACRNNPIPLIVPCHRVVAKSGLGGFAGDRREGWTELKRWLLHHEGSL